LRTTVPTAGLSVPVTVQVAASPLTSTEKSPPTLPRSNVPLPEVPERPDRVVVAAAVQVAGDDRGWLEVDSVVGRRVAELDRWPARTGHRAGYDDRRRAVACIDAAGSGDRACNFNEVGPADAAAARDRPSPRCSGVLA
jgi:hypothetical protein